MNTNKIYYSPEGTEISHQVQAVYTVPGDLQLVKVVLQPEQSYSKDQQHNDLFMTVDSGIGEISVQYPSEEVRYLLKENTTVIVPRNLAFTVTNTPSVEVESLTVGSTTAVKVVTNLALTLVYSGSEYPSNYVKDQGELFGPGKAYSKVFKSGDSKTKAGVKNLMTELVKGSNRVTKLKTDKTGLFHPDNKLESKTLDRVATLLLRKARDDTPEGKAFTVAVESALEVPKEYDQWRCDHQFFEMCPVGLATPEIVLPKQEVVETMTEIWGLETHPTKPRKLPIRRALNSAYLDAIELLEDLELV